MSAVKKININGHDYPVRYDLNAICEFQELTGSSLLSGDAGETFRDPKAIRALVFVGLKSGHRFENGKAVKFEHDIDDVGGWLGFADGTFQKFIEALNASMIQGVSGSPTEEGEKKPGE